MQTIFKNSLILLLMMSSSFLLAQKTIYVNNYQSLLGHFSNLQTAIDSAKSGDVLLLSGSPNSYGNVEIPSNKNINIIGTGHHPMSKNPLTAKVNSITLQSNAKAINIEALVINQINAAESNIRQISISNCQINSGIVLGDGAVEFNVFSNIFTKNATISADKKVYLNNIHFENNFFYLPQIGPLEHCQNVNFSNNLFAGKQILQNKIVFNEVKNANVEGNTFHYILAFSDKKHNNYLSNNLSSVCDISLLDDFASNTDLGFFDYEFGGDFSPEFDFRNKTKEGIYEGNHLFSMTGEAQKNIVVRELLVSDQQKNGATLDFSFSFKANKPKLFAQNPSRYFTISNYLEKFDQTDTSKITEVEYFLDTDPGVGLATKLVLSKPYSNEINVASSKAQFKNLNPQQTQHTLYVRCKNSKDQWSQLQYATFDVEKTDVELGIVKLPEPICNIKTATLIEFFVKNNGNSDIPAHTGVLTVFNKKVKKEFNVQIPQLKKNAKQNFIFDDKNKDIIENDSIYVGLNSDFLESQDQNPLNQSIAIPNIRTEILELKLSNIQSTTCFGFGDGKANIKVVETKINQTYQYVWETSGNGNVQYQHGSFLEIKHSPTGWQKITVTDKDGCYATAKFYIPEIKPLALVLKTTSDYNGQPISCIGKKDATLEARICGGTGKYNFYWSHLPFVSESNIAAKLGAGTYNLSIEDYNNCKISDVITIVDPTPITTNISKSTFQGYNISCNGGNNGSINYKVTGGTGALTYKWSNGATTPLVSNLTAGVYTVTTTDINGCNLVQSITLIEPPLLTISKTSTQPKCNAASGTSNGTINITPSGGTGAFSYNWGAGVTTQNRTGLGAGTYTVTVTDANGCKATNATTITQPNAVYNNFITSYPVTCNGGSNGSVTLNAAGGTGVVTVTPAYTGLSAGLYTFTATDANGCTATTSTTIIQPTVITISKTSTNVSCNGGTNGTINITPSGGTGAFSYNWGGGITTQNRTGLGAGTYTVTVTDANFCTATNTTTLTQPTAVYNNFIASYPVTCNGGSNGSVTLDAAGGTGLVTVLPVQTGLPAGLHVFTATDVNGCTATTSTTITQPTAVSIAKTSTNPTCNAGTNGTINITPSGGTGAFSYNWGGGITTQNRTGLGAGTYTVTITDANFCTVTNTTTLTQPTAITIAKTSTNPTCNAGTNGTINITPSGGTGAFSYNWGGGVTTQNRTGLGAGTYTVTVTDANGCTAISSTTITEPLAVAIVSHTLVPGCPGFWEIEVGQVNYAVGALTYLWSNGASTIATQVSTLGTYTVTVTDANGCTVSTSQTITIPPGPPISIALAPTYPLCNGQSNGIITTTVTGATAPISYSWDDGPTTQNRTGLAHNKYQVVIIDNNGCTAFNSVQIYNPPALVGYIGVIFPPTCNGGNNGSITINVAGGTGSSTTIPNPSALTSGLHNFTFTDANGCTATASATVPVTPPITVNAVSTNISPTQTDVFASISNGFGISSYVWNPNNGTGSTISITPLQPYSITITDTNGCTGVGSGVAARLAQNNNSIDPYSKLELINTTENDVLIAPNPASTMANFNFLNENITDFDLEILDIAGKRIEYKVFQKGNMFSLDISDYMNGVYVLKFMIKNERPIVKKLVVQKN